MSQASSSLPPRQSGSEARVDSIPDASRLIWVDMEMSGLNPGVDRVLEIAIVVTDSELTIISQSEGVAIAQPETVLGGMDQWNQSTHARSGLTARVRASTLTEAAVEQRMIDFLAPLVPAGASPMCGNSVCQDRRFMARYMPRLEAWFHYRNVDVSTLKELCKRWRPDIVRGFAKRGAHTALADIIESIEELRYYRTQWIEPASAQAHDAESKADEPDSTTLLAGGIPVPPAI